MKQNNRDGMVSASIHKNLDVNVDQALKLHPCIPMHQRRLAFDA